jgi:hypothetical protein
MPKDCKETQELNPFTRRCNKKCDIGKVRNEEWKCVFPPKQCKPNYIYDDFIKKCVKKCTAPQIRNLKTGRCLNPCKSGTIRDMSTMRCKKVSSKSRKRTGTKEHHSRKLSSKLRGCLSYGRTPKRCINKRDYERQRQLFSMTNNLECSQDASDKMYQLNHLCSNL